MASAKAREQLAHKLMILAKLPPGHPTDDELDSILEEVSEHPKPSEATWKAAAGKHVRGAGTYKYAGEDMSNLNMLLTQILNQGGSSGTAPVKK